MITIPLQIRPSDQDSLGHVNNAAYVACVEHAVAEFLVRQGFVADWRGGDGPCRWMIRELAIEYRQAASYGDQISALVWLAEADASLPLLGCQLRRSGESEAEVIVRARSRWQRQLASTGEAMTLPQSFLVASGPDEGDLPRPFKAPAETADVRRYAWRHRVERREVGPGDRVHPHALFEWIEQSILCASEEAGWPIERYLDEKFIVLQMRHDATFYSAPLLGEEVEIVSGLISARRLYGTWQNEIRSLADGRPLGVNYSAGVFLNLDGRPTSPPPGLVADLQQTTA